MHFSVVFAALIHDVDHPGLSNQELVDLRTPTSVIYKGKSISEQNSLEVAWRVLMDQDFDKLRSCIYTNKQELTRFRQLLVNAVMATDLLDEDLYQTRTARWEAAFGTYDASRGAGGLNSSSHHKRQALGDSSHHRQQQQGPSNSSHHRRQQQEQGLSNSSHHRQQQGLSNSSHHRQQSVALSSSNHRRMTLQQPQQELDCRSSHGNHNMDHSTLERKATRTYSSCP